MTCPLIARVARAQSTVLALIAIVGCASEQPQSPRFTDRASATVDMPVAPPTAPPYSPYSLVIPAPPQENGPYRLVPGTPEGDGLCQPGSLRCGEIHPTPGRLCLLSAQRCPRDGKFERMEGAAPMPFR